MLILFLIIILIEVKFKPRIDILFNGDVVLWYDNVDNKRVYKVIYKK